MKKIYLYLPIALFAFILSSCTEKKQEMTGTTPNIAANLDTTINKGTSFYDYATLGWAKANPMPPENSRFGSFDLLAKNNQLQIQGLIEELGKGEHNAGTVEQKIGSLYSIAMDSAKLQADGAKPILAQLEEINNATSKEEIIDLIGKTRINGGTPFFGVYVGADMKNSDSNIINLYQSGLNLGDRDYYLNTDSTSLAILKGYNTLIEVQLQNAGYSEAAAKKAAIDVLKIETAIAKVHLAKEETRHRDKYYHKMTTADLNAQVADFDWIRFFNAAHMTNFQELVVTHKEPIGATIKLINALPIDEIKSYLAWNVINSASGFLSDNFVDTNFEFYGKIMTGVEAQQPRWKRAVNTTSGVLSEAVGQIYVEKYFSAQAKEKMLELVDNLQKSFAERITDLTWMSEETKVKAHEKLNTFTVKIGYPDKWKDYSLLEIKDDSYWANITRANLFDWKEMTDKIGKPVDKTEWHMPPQMVNAYYNPTTNEICFPAAILQPPFFYLNGDDAVNYGAIGVVIGHEMSHGFDDQGRKFDKEGNMFDWWTADDATQFNERAQVLIDHFDKIQILPGLLANGTFTLGENIGDFGGLQVAFHAYSKTDEAKATQQIDGFSPQQRFFLSYAGVWAGHIREADMRRLTQMDVHSLGKWRVDGTLPHMDAWYDAFNIIESDSLYIPKEKRAAIW